MGYRYSGTSLSSIIDEEVTTAKVNTLTITIILVYLILVVSAITTVLENIDRQGRAISWILAILLIPFGGLFFYFFFGRKRRRDRKLLGYRHIINTEKNISRPELFDNKMQLANLLNNNDSSSLSYNNKVDLYYENDVAIEQIYNHISQAKKFIHLEFYIVEDGKLLTHLIELCAAKVLEGVAVRLIYDGYGSYNLSGSSKAALNKAGVETQSFMPFKFGKWLKHANNRNHRKCIIIDNQVAFTGGFNIMDAYLVPDKKLGLWKDVCLKLKGSAVSDLNKVFTADWHYAGGPKIVSCKAYNSEENLTPVHITTSGPSSLYQSIMQEYFTIITDAEDYVYIATPYFIPNDAIMTALVSTALSGVSVELMIPAQSDFSWLKHCMYSYFEKLLAANVKIYLYRDGFTHSKIIISDDFVSSIGSANLDERSFEVNFELNAVIYDGETAMQAADNYRRNKAFCEQLKIETFHKRPDRNRILEPLAKLISPIL